MWDERWGLGGSMWELHLETALDSCTMMIGWLGDAIDTDNLYRHYRDEVVGQPCQVEHGQMRRVSKNRILTDHIARLRHAFNSQVSGDGAI